MIRSLLKALPVALLVLVVGCASKPPLLPLEPAAEARWRQHIASILAQPDWTLMGRAAIHADQQGWSATLHWQQQSDRYAIRILGPLGQGAAWLRGDARGVTLQTSDGHHLQAQDAETLLYTQFGWQVPVGGLRYWLRGVPDPAERYSASWDEHTRLSVLKQSGWTIHFDRYVTVDGRAIPDKISLKNARFSVRMVVQDWQAAALQP